jgi:hypothetical protein
MTEFDQASRDLIRRSFKPPETSRDGLNANHCNAHLKVGQSVSLEYYEASPTAHLFARNHQLVEQAL